MRQVRSILPWAERHAIALSAVFVPGVDHWEANYLSRQDLHPGELGLHSDIFHQFAMGWGLPEVDLMASRLKKKVAKYICGSGLPVHSMEFQLGVPVSSTPMCFHVS